MALQLTWHRAFQSRFPRGVAGRDPQLLTIALDVNRSGIAPQPELACERRLSERGLRSTAGNLY